MDFKEEAMIRALMELLGNFYQSSNFSQVEVIAHTIRTAMPDDMISLQVLGLAYLKTGRTADALRLFRKADRGRPPPVLESSVGAGDGQSQFEVATSVYYREATCRSPGLARLWYDLGNELIGLKRPQQSIWAFRAATVASPPFPAALMSLGSTGLQVGDLDAAYEGFSGLLAIEPDNVAAQDGLDATSSHVCGIPMAKTQGSSEN